MKTGWEAIVVGNWCIQGVSIFPFLCWFCNYLTLFFKTEPSSFLLILLLQNIGFFIVDDRATNKEKIDASKNELLSTV